MSDFRGRVASERRRIELERLSGRRRASERAAVVGSNGAFPSRYQFTGREFDSTIGLQFSRARFYDPKLGRFISEDPIGFAG
ncbi:MAG: RHS repeat-associated core domain-containing protein, partial [bacterium]|nr:RHS repeat-associated core domain-containing protein [bacterium]